MLKNIDPPLGFGNKCPNRLAYKKLIRMNMPVDQDGKVQFTTTLFALIRENLSIKMRCGMYYFVFLLIHSYNRVLRKHGTIYVCVGGLYYGNVFVYNTLRVLRPRLIFSLIDYFNVLKPNIFLNSKKKISIRF